MARAAIYMRVSSPGQEENYSLPEQEKDCKQFAAHNSHDVYKIYNDGAQKSYTLNRPALNELMQDARHGEFELLIVGKYDRFSRSQVQQAVAIYQLEQYGVKIESVSEPVPDGIVGTFIRQSFAFAAEVELYKIRDRTTSGRKARIRAGKILAGGMPLYGYLWTNPHEKHGKDAYIPDPETEWVVRLIYEMVLAGRSLRSISAELEERGILTPGQVLQSRGQLAEGRTCSSVWRLSTLKRILSNPAYIGKHSNWRSVTEEVREKDPITGEIRTVSRTRDLDADSPDRIYLPEAACPALVDDATFNAAQLILKRNKEEAARNLGDAEGVLLRNGFAVCGYCKRNMVAKFHNGNNHYRYLCSAGRDLKTARCPNGEWSLTAANLDRLVWSWVVEAFHDPKIIRDAYEDWKQQQSDGRSYEYDRLANMQDLMRKTEQRWRNCLASAADAPDEDSRQEFTHMASKAREDLRQLEDEHGKLGAVLTQQDEEIAEVDKVVAMGTQALDKLRTADYQTKRTFLHALGFKITVKSMTDFDVQWRLAYKPGAVVQSSFYVPEDPFSGTQKVIHLRWTAQEVAAGLERIRLAQPFQLEAV